MRQKFFQVYIVINTQLHISYLAYTLNGVKCKSNQCFMTNSALYEDIQKLGIENFKKEVLGIYSSRNDAKIAFRSLLAKLKSEGKKLYNDMCSYGYVYLTTNTVNGMKYIGQHRVSGNPKIDSNYFGSGAAIQRALRKYGKEAFRKEILAECDNEDQLNAKEIELIEQYDAVNRKDFYNIAKGGEFGDTWTGRSAHKKRQFRKRIAQSNSTRDRDSSKICGKNNPAYGKHWYKDISTRKQYLLADDDPIIVQLNLERGMFRTKKHNQKIAEANKGKKKTYVVFAKGKVVVNDGQKNKLVDPSELQVYLDKGYVRGNINYNLRNRVHMNDGTRNYCISKNKVKFYIEEKNFSLGWIKKII